MQNVGATYLSQFANSPILTALIESLNDAIDPTRKIDDFYDSLWNIDTARGYGLDVWGRIVGVTRSLDVPATGVFFGFSVTGLSTAAQPTKRNFNHGVFNTRVSVQSTYLLSDDAYRTLILFKAFVNVTACDIPSLNRIARVLLGGVSTFYYVDPGYVDEGYVEAKDTSRAYVVDNLDMTMTYVFDFPLTPVQAAIVAKPGLLPHPTGVAVSVVHS